METAIVLVIIIGILALLATTLLGGKGDKNYAQSTKGNLSRLTWIYLIICIGSLIALAIYLF